MRILIILSVILLLTNCKSKIKPDKNKTIDALQLFTEVESFNKDLTSIWPYNFVSPTLIIDSDKQLIYANKANQDLEKYKAIYFGTLPADWIPTVKKIRWHNEDWNMFTWPIPKDSIQRQHMLFLQLFSNNEANFGFDKISTPDCNHLNEHDKRVWMKIEAEALKEALVTNDKEIQREHIRMAIAARKIRSTITGELFSRENNLDLKYGFPELIWIMMNKLGDVENSQQLYASLDSLQKSSYFMRSFSNCFFPTYGYLMNTISKDWLTTINDKTVLNDLVMNFYGFTYTEDFMELMTLLQSRYRGTEFEIQESKRDKEFIQLSTVYSEQFLHSPFVMIRLGKNTSITYDLNEIIPFLDKGNIYNNIKAIDNWGTLTGTKGILINSQRSYLYLPAPYEIKNNIASGENWSLELNKGFTIKPYPNSDKFIVTNE